MGKIQIEEAEHTRLVAEAGRVETLTSERDTAVQERDAARRELAESRARDAATERARKRVTEANSTLPTAAVDRIVTSVTATVPLTESGVLDEAKLDLAVDEARKGEETYLASLTGGGSNPLTGFGESGGGQPPVAESKLTHTPWGRPLAESKKG